MMCNRIKQEISGRLCSVPGLSRPRGELTVSAAFLPLSQQQDLDRSDRSQGSADLASRWRPGRAHPTLPEVQALYAFNLDGASIFLGVATIFIAQLYGIDLSLSQQALLVVTMVLTSKGAAGVPGFAIVILSATLASAGMPLDGVALIAGIFRIIDSGTTTLNVLGNAIAPLVIAKWEGVELSPQVDEGIAATA